jgi:DNA adenine methylase
MFDEYSSVIHINDYDPRVSCFWQSVINHTDELCEMIEKTPVNIHTWLHQKEIQSYPSRYSVLEVGFSTFFLNRTNRSGILDAGVIGGLDQTGKWKIDARYNREALIQRIRRIGLYRERIELYNLDAIDFVMKLRRSLPRKTLLYFDPPYYLKSEDLYVNFYRHEDHVRISKVIRSLSNKYWLISYDNDEVINRLYKRFRRQQYGLKYHAGSTSEGQEILIFSNKLIVPNLLNPLDKKEIREYSQLGLSADWQPNFTI